MRYSKLLWQHTSFEEPFEIYSEHDDFDREVRKIELFRDGTVGFASISESNHGTQLSLITCPPDEEVNLLPEFQVQDISQDDFELLWQAVHGYAAVA